jgi:hypothetical protein
VAQSSFLQSCQPKNAALDKIADVQRLRSFIVTHASSSVNRLVVLFAFYVAASLPAEMAFAQSVGAVLSGTVADMHGGVRTSN